MSNEIGTVLISSEEYKNLILKEKKLEDLQIDFTYTKGKLVDTESKLEQAENEIKELLATITGGKTESKFEQSFFEYYELSKLEDIAKYINNFYMKDKKLQPRKIIKEGEEELSTK